MCGRYAQFHSESDIKNLFQLESIPELKSRYNIAPTQQVATISRDSTDCDRANAQRCDRQLKFRRWGLIPSWAKDANIGARLINARGETVAEKPSFRNAFRRRRCLIIADGFYEWQKLDKIKQPYYINLQDERTFAFAGLWETWKNPEGEVVETCTIITTTANEIMTPIHERMPVILAPENYDLWLDPQADNLEQLQEVLRPAPNEQINLQPVSTKVNNAKYDRLDCLEKV
jgi:putative SOS response-associated peptidase YedK